MMWWRIALLVISVAATIWVWGVWALWNAALGDYSIERDLYTLIVMFGLPVLFIVTAFSTIRLRARRQQEQGR